MSNSMVRKKLLPWILLSMVSCVIILAQGRIIGQHERGLFPRYPKSFRFEMPYFGFVYTGESGNWIDDRVLQFGAFEKPELFLLREIVADQRGFIFLDVGANTGLYTLFMAPLVERVHAVEPFPPVLQKLRAHIEKNHLKNVDVHPVGFGNQKGSLLFHAPPQANHGVGSFSSDFADGWRASDGQQFLDGQLPLEIGDQYLEEHSVGQIDVMKLDIEGYEKLALQGLKQTLLKSRPYILMELNTLNVEGFHSLEELEATFPPNYRFFAIKYNLEDLDTGHYELEPLMRLPSRQINILAVPHDRRAIAK